MAARDLLLGSCLVLALAAALPAGAGEDRSVEPLAGDELTPEVITAITRGLDYLARNQDRDGSF
ncbi:MAG TPA: prenyltransferase, partial [Planctomycetota bacterium]|nr:prenyltransferase [Planctomycetota bacterium]